MDVRIIAATNRDLVESMEKGEFRSDLYYRLNVISIKVPPLRERKDDIPILMQYFLQRYNQKFAKNIRASKKRSWTVSHIYRWPGNVRELENFIERGVALEKGPVFSSGSLPSEVIYNLDAAQAPGEDWQDLLEAEQLQLQPVYRRPQQEHHRQGPGAEQRQRQENGAAAAGQLPLAALSDRKIQAQIPIPDT